MKPARPVLFAALAGAAAASLVWYLGGEPSQDELVGTLALIFIFWPLMGALIRFLGGERPYQSALAAGAIAQILGLGFSLSRFGFPWGAIAASFIIASLVEGLVLVAMGTARPLKSFGISFYMNLVVHILTSGRFLWVGRPGLATALFALGFLLFILPIFVVERPLGGRELERPSERKR